jgi:hypothetical protein
LSEDSLLERIIAAAEERQLSIHSSPPCDARGSGERASGRRFGTTPADFAAAKKLIQSPLD